MGAVRHHDIAVGSAALVGAAMVVAAALWPTAALVEGQNDPVHDSTATASGQNGQSQSLAGAGAQPITMTDRFGQTVAGPSGIGADGASFAVTRQQPSTSAEPGRSVIIVPFPHPGFPLAPRGRFPFDPLPGQGRSWRLDW